jgi:hypothetical protein
MKLLDIATLRLRRRISFVFAKTMWIASSQAPRNDGQVSVIARMKSEAIHTHPSLRAK